MKKIYKVNTDKHKFRIIVTEKGHYEIIKFKIDGMVKFQTTNTILKD